MTARTLVLGVLVLSLGIGEARGAGNGLPNPILFVTQVPIAADYTTVGSVFGNHMPSLQQAGRGGDLYILYPDGTLKNLTHLAGFGMSGFQGATSIAVREPSVHWSGTKALFSMAVGSTTVRYVWQTYYWQIYEVTGLGEADTPVITKVPQQPSSYNNVAPFYGTDGRILFTSDRPRGGETHLYPQLDEYEEAPSITGLWSLDPVSGDLRLLNHTPSGLFSPSIDSFGRVVFTRWDHLQRDQQADSDALYGDTYGTFNYADESASAAKLDSRDEVFPEPRSERTDLLAGTNLEGHSINHFFPWTIDEDGTAEETIDHIGRHELHGYFDRSFNDDVDLHEFISAVSGRYNQNLIENFLEIKEDPAHPGTYFGIDAPEFSTHAAGQVVSLNAPAGLPADQIAVTYGTARSTSTYTEDGVTPPPDDSGLYRNPLPLSDGTLLAVHTSETRADKNEGTTANPTSRYSFRIKRMTSSGGVLTADTTLTTGIARSVSWYDPDTLVTWSGTLWELDPVEVRARPIPTPAAYPLDTPEAAVFSEEGVDPAEFRKYLSEHDLAVIVSRNVTTRDHADLQQPYNLQVAGSSTKTIGNGGKLYPIAHLQLFQADQLRGLGGTSTPKPGRRVLAQLLHDPAATAKNPPDPGGPPSSVKIASDGSIAAFVPAHRATSWQTTDGTGTPVVRERYWLTFQPGEVRVCASCHGLNSHDQANETVPTNEPAALHTLLQAWKASLRGDVNGDGHVNVADVFALINALFAGGPPPVGIADVNHDGKVDLGDVFSLISYLFAGGTPPAL
jgi:hypothetical protein